MKTLPVVTITYCSQCNWLLRAAWMSQELLSTFSTDLAQVTLIPATGGIYQITVDDQLIWDRKTMGGFPDAAEIKRRLRAQCFPERELGHIDKKSDSGPERNGNG
ncbi:SelT/SelW/SelH family protein [Winslowiella sp. 2C04]|uniref:SelT/SelW/SelH family protein n=1 Tax=Winslowiella sp. 2C04 TaxID=3416179 RepID=UPI003CF1D2EE